MLSYRCAVLAAISSLTLSGAALAAPAVTLLPGVGPPTSNVAVSGTGFGANAAVDIFFDTTDVCLALANGVGAISCPIKIPSSAQPQAHWISAVERAAGTGAQKAFTVRTDMPQFHGRDARHQGSNPFENTLNSGNVQNLDVLWTAHVGSAANTIASPVVAGGNVFVGGFDGTLNAFNAQTGGPVANFPKSQANALFVAAPAVGGGNVYIGSLGGDDFVYGYNISTGSPAPGSPMATVPAAPIRQAVSFAAGALYFGDDTGKVFGIDTASGAALPNFPITVSASAIGGSSPTVWNGNLYVGALDDKLYGFNIATGTALGGFFPVATGGFVRSTPAVYGGTLYFGSEDHNLYAVRADDGSAISGFPVALTNAIQTSPAVAGGKVFVTTVDGKLSAINALTGGALLWTVTLDSATHGSPVVANGIVYVLTPNRLSAYFAATGQALGGVNIKTLDSLATVPVIANGIVYLAGNGGNLYALSVNGLPPASRLPGGEMGVKPALSALRPDYALRPSSGANVDVTADHE